jgi:hypothetical protein
MTPTIFPSGRFVRFGDANAGSRIPCDVGLSKAANVQSCSGDAEAMPASGPSPRYAPEALPPGEIIAEALRSADRASRRAFTAMTSALKRRRVRFAALMEQLFERATVGSGSFQ